jgi:hypothetical protein
MRRTVIGGLVWLVLSGLLWVQQGELGTGAGSDAAIHAFFMGFVMSMVFAHAPMVFAAVTRIRVPYYRALAIPLVILYVGLVVRIVGDLGVDRALAKWGAVVTGAAVVLYIAFVVASAVAALAGYAPARPKRQGPVPK